MSIQWHRASTHPAEYIFPAKTIQERDMGNGRMLRETKSEGPLGLHYLELLGDNRVMADAYRVGRRWSVAICAPTWPHKHQEYRFRCNKAEAVAALVGVP
jgi:hypothetical protein